MRKVLKNIKELILATSIIWMPIGGSYLIEELDKHIHLEIDFNWLGLVLPIPICIGFILLLIYTLKGE